MAMVNQIKHGILEFMWRYLFIFMSIYFLFDLIELLNLCGIKVVDGFIINLLSSLEDSRYKLLAEFKYLTRYHLYDILYVRHAI
jgi:hypothetical protein